MSEVNNSIAELKRSMVELGYNPAGSQLKALALLREVHEGKIEVLDASTPFSYSLMISAAQTSAFMDEALALNRRQYPAEALTMEDLYLHMSDRDYVNRFAMPSHATFRIAFDKDELLQRLVEDTSLGVRKLVIPRNSQISVNNMTFTLQYPIEIRQLQHGGLQVLYNTNISTPLQTLETNKIEYYSVNNADMNWLFFDIDLYQLVIRTSYLENNSITRPEMDLILTDYYNYLRAFMEVNGDWVELKTTHTDMVYDQDELTAVLAVFEDRVNVHIPQIYLSRGMVTGRLRFDLYETKANITMDLSVYPSDVFQGRWETDFLDVGLNTFSAPLKTLKTIGVSSESITIGGAAAMTLADLKRATIDNAVGLQELPITPIQATSALKRIGYDIVTTVDNLRTRELLATRKLPAPNNEKLITPASASIETIVVSESEVKNALGIKTNFRSVTITPDTVFQQVGGMAKVCSKAKIDGIKALRPELIANEVSQQNYYYTPFHYVLDFKEDEFNSRPYYLDGPKIMYKNFISDNDKTLMQVSVNESEIIRTDEGYKLLITVTSSDNYKAVADNRVQTILAFKPTGEKEYAYLMGQMIGVDDAGERIFSFNLATNFYVSKGAEPKDDELMLSQFKIYTVDDRLVPCPLDNEFDILFATTADMPMTWEKDEVDAKLPSFLVPTWCRGIANESIRIKFGVSLRKSLWARSRSVISSADYARYDNDVMAVYENDIYDIDPVTGSSVQFVGGNPQFTIKHAKGSPVLGPDGNQLVKFRKNDVMVNADGKPVFSNEFYLTRQLDLLLIEGAYWFATDETTAEYRQELIDTYMAWMESDLGVLRKNLIEETTLYFYPKATIGQVETMFNNSIRRMGESGQKFKVSLYVSSIVYGNIDLRKKIEQSTIRVISQCLEKQVVNKSDIIDALKENYGNDVIGFDITGLGGSDNIHTVTVLNDAKRLSIRKRLVAQGNGSLIVEEDVTCDFQRHDVKELQL